MEQGEKAGRGGGATGEKGQQTEKRPAVVCDAINGIAATTASDTYDTHHANDTVWVGPKGAEGADALAGGGRAPVT